MPLETQLRSLRRRLGLSQAAAARIFGVTATTWQNWEYSGRTPGPARALVSILDRHPELVEEVRHENQTHHQEDAQAASNPDMVRPL
jgi:transcriptional regulator with XRE-family HTH domain